MSEGQQLALRQLERIVKARPGALDILSTHPPSGQGALRLEVSVSCAAIETASEGLRLRARERFVITVPADFPYEQPGIGTVHRRWAGTPHVQWGKHLCLYQAASEWNPADGMFGFAERLEGWLIAAAKDQLDPADAPLHPPAIYPTGSALIVPRADTPPVASEPWMGAALVRRPSRERVDIVGWELSPDALLTGRGMPALLVPFALSWEYPERVSELVDALVAEGVSRDRLLLGLQAGAHGTPEGAPMLVVIGTAMRGRAGERRQHLAVWQIAPELTRGLRSSLRRFSPDPAISEIGREIADIVTEWALNTRLEWCPVREARPEVTRRRDEGSPLTWFEGKRVVIWGAGALGGPLAEWIARAGAKELIVYDHATVSPGLLVRQPFADSDIGLPKATVLAKRLRALELPGLEVHEAFQDVRAALGIGAWHEDADLVIDATASPVVRAKLERVRRGDTGNVPVLAIMVGARSQRALGVLCGPGYSGGPVDALRQLKLACYGDGRLGEFVRDFWPDGADADRPPFQPEPGCSDLTFQGSQAEIAGLTGWLLTRLTARLTTLARESACAELVSIGRAAADESSSAGFAFDQAVVLAEEDREVRLSHPAWRSIEGWIARSQRIETEPGTETGGLLYGERDEAAGVVWVDEVIGPPPDSTSSPEEFRCGIQGTAAQTAERRKRGRGSLEFVGTWHTHPGGRARPSPRDLEGGAQILLEQGAAPSEVLLLIIGGIPRHATPELGAYFFEGEQLSRGVHRVAYSGVPRAVPLAPAEGADIGLALSGGGSRAIAFHLGCLRALHDCRMLDRVSVVSGISGGSIAAALWAYRRGSFQEFDAELCSFLHRGLQGAVVRGLVGRRGVQAMGTQITAGTAAAGARALALAAKLGQHIPGLPDLGFDGSPPARRWVSRTDALADALGRRLFGDLRLEDARRRDDLEVVLNACELATGAAFRFGSRESGCARFGRLARNDVPLAEAVAASAAYPLFLPALDRDWEFTSFKGEPSHHRVVFTDGGVFDNLGTSTLEPGRSAAYSTNVFPEVRYIVACDAGRGLPTQAIPFGLSSRVMRSFEATHRKAQDAARARLHALRLSGEIEGFLLPYLGQQDRRLALPPADLVRREEVLGYPTNFAPMAEADLERLARRGEQLTRALIDEHPRWKR